MPGYVPGIITRSSVFVILRVGVESKKKVGTRVDEDES
jgi:hypothetical protein